jgi:hypothetical protein
MADVTNCVDLLRTSDARTSAAHKGQSQQQETIRKVHAPAGAHHLEQAGAQQTAQQADTDTGLSLADTAPAGPTIALEHHTAQVNHGAIDQEKRRQQLCAQAAAPPHAPRPLQYMLPLLPAPCLLRTACADDHTSKPHRRVIGHAEDVQGYGSLYCSFVDTRLEGINHMQWWGDTLVVTGDNSHFSAFTLPSVTEVRRRSSILLRRIERASRATLCRDLLRLHDHACAHAHCTSMCMLILEAQMLAC